MKKRAKRWLSILAILAVLAGATIHLQSQKKGTQDSKPITSKKDKNRNTALPVEGVILRHILLSENLMSVGNMMPDETVDLSFESSGKVAEICFLEGTEVKKGQLLARLNNAPLKAELEKLETQLPLYESRLYRQKMLLAKEAVSKESYDIVSTDLSKLHADIAVCKANIALGELKAPFSGTIGLRQISEGGYATTSTVIATLTKTKPIKIEFSYPERYTNKIVKGTPIEFSIEGTLEPYHASVYAVEPVVENGIKTQTARAKYPNSNGELTAGRFVNVFITLERREKAIAVPSQALISDIGNTIVYTYNGGKAKPNIVKTGLRTDTQVEILEGLELGDTVITTAIMQLRPSIGLTLEEVK